MYDVTVIGGGPAGFAASMYSARAGLKTLVIESMFPGGQMTLTDKIENYPGIDEPISGYELAGRMEKQSRKFGTEILNDTAVDFKLDKKIKIVKTVEGMYQSRAVVLSMGTEPRKLGLPDENRLTGAGVSYCATCDGSFFKGMEVAVIGGGDTAAEEALYLSRLCSKVCLVHRRDALRAARSLRERVFENERIDIIWNSLVEEIMGSDSVEGMRIKNVKTGERRDIGVDGIFVAIGAIPRTDTLKGVVALNDDGYVITDDRMRTSIPGVFAAGDIREKALRQIVTAVSDGAIAAHMAEGYITSQ